MMTATNMKVIAALIFTVVAAGLTACAGMPDGQRQVVIAELKAFNAKCHGRTPSNDPECVRDAEASRVSGGGDGS